VFDQIIIYGPKGWLGRTALAYFNSIYDFTKDSSHLILVGRQTEDWVFEGRVYSIINSEMALKVIRGDALFVNCAFLRRENLAKIGAPLYFASNLEMMSFTKLVVKTGKIKSLINFSSGVAAKKETEDIFDGNDLYADLKFIDEYWLKDTTDLMGTCLVNCRVYSLSGKYLNEFENLALGRFLYDALHLKYIHVTSSLTLRTYLSARNLIEVLFAIASKGESVSLDSGAELVNMRKLAVVISSFFPGTKVEFNYETPNSYFGNFRLFSSIASDLGVKLLDINEQIKEMLPLSSLLRRSQ